MQAKLLLVGALALLLSSCSGGVTHPPPPLDKKLLTGKWKAGSDSAFISGYEIAEDGTAKMNVRGMGQPVPARYTWSGERTLSLEYEAAPDVQQAYKAAAKAYKDDIMEGIKAGKLNERAGPSILSAVEDELPPRETLQVGLSAQPRLLILGREGGASQTFELAE
jgi:hypothetical protein